MVTTPKPTETAATPAPGNTSGNNTSATPHSLGGLLLIFGAMVLIVLIPIAIFAWYNKKTLEHVLNANNGLTPDTKRESISTLIKALIPPEPLGMPNGSVRTVIAIIGISIFSYSVYIWHTPELVAALITLVSSVTGFYFGARATEPVRESGPTSPLQ